MDTRRRLRSLDRLPVALTLIILALGMAGWLIIFPAEVGERFGGDLEIYLDATRRWVDGGSFYLERQLSGPYRIETGDVLYPPTTIPLFLPFLVLPVALWWAVPIVASAWAIRRLRPAAWTWPFMAAFLVFPHTGWLIVSGNPVMWAVAALALGAVGGWPAALVLLKPTLAPFALLGVRSPGWWAMLAVGITVGVLFLPLWDDFLRVIDNAVGPRADPLYSLLDVPLMLVPLVAWLGRDGRGVSEIASSALGPARQRTYRADLREARRG